MGMVIKTGSTSCTLGIQDKDYIYSSLTKDLTNILSLIDMGCAGTCISDLPRN